MSIQRRRVLVNSKIPDGVYIEGLDGNAYTVDNWHGGANANSVIVASGDVKFRIALWGPTNLMSMSPNYDSPLENYMTAISGETQARADYNGAGNTANILKAVQPSTGYAAGFCDAFVFPDGKTRGYVPSVGQMNLMYQNREAVLAAFGPSGGSGMFYTHYWTSTFWGIHPNTGVSRICYAFNWPDAKLCHDFAINAQSYVRPFADIS